MSGGKERWKLTRWKKRVIENVLKINSDTSDGAMQKERTGRVMESRHKRRSIGSEEILG